MAPAQGFKIEIWITALGGLIVNSVGINNGVESNKDGAKLEHWSVA